MQASPARSATLCICVQFSELEVAQAKHAILHRHLASHPKQDDVC